MLRPRIVGAIVGSLLLLSSWCVTASAQEAKSASDDALDSLIEKLADPPATRADARSEEKPKSGEPGPSRKQETSKEGGKPKAAGDKAPKADDVAPKDQELDSLLEKLGESKDEPQADDNKRPHPGADAEKDEEGGPKGRPSKSGQLGKKDQELDERLEELTGRRRKKKQDREDEGSGPVSDVVKQMREIEKRLSQPDTGEETQQKQKQIVKRLQTLIEQARQSGSSSSKQMKIRQVRQAGQKPGGAQGGEQASNNPGGAPLTKPSKPTNQRSAATGKDIWGHLPPELRQEMENSFKEEALPDRIELIKRYYLSVSKNKLVREE